jgi:lytic murein transglycosylase
MIPVPLHRAALLAAFVLAGSLPARAALLDQPMPPEQFAACVQGLAGQTASAGRPLTRDDFLRVAASARYDDRVRQALLVQAGEPTFWWDDIAATTDDERVEEGRRILGREAAVLQQIEARWGVPKEIVVAIYGIETNYGPSAGKIPVLDSALTLACLRPCPPASASCAARERAYAAVRLLRDGRVRPESFVGSWAAAFGRTQFVPDTFEQIAVDFDGDGVADLVNSERDAWASTANHLQRRGGWIAGVPVYVEVQVPAALRAQVAAADHGARNAGRWRKASQFAAEGWQALDARGAPVPLPVPPDTELRIFLPVGLPGPAFLVSRNFHTIFRYNNSDRYVMEVSVLANRIAGGPGIVTAWPTDDPGLSRAQIRQLQEWLLQRGHALVVADGVMGRNTRDAIEAERARKGLPAGRRVGQRTMQALMQ